MEEKLRKLYCLRCKKWQDFLEVRDLNIHNKIVVVKCNVCSWRFIAEENEDYEIID